MLGFMATFGFNTGLVRTNVDQFIRWRIVVGVNFFPIFVIFLCILFDFMP